MIAGRYQPLEPVRPGAPFKARDASTAQTVVIHAAPGAAAFHRGCLVAGIFHPSLVTMFDVFRDEAGATCVAVEWVEARTARQVMAGVPLNARRAAAITAEIADAVAELHAGGVSHGAISVDSVRLTSKGKAKLDLGALRIGEVMTRAVVFAHLTMDIREASRILYEKKIG